MATSTIMFMPEGRYNRYSRRVLLAVELLDPLTWQPVWRGMEVRAQGLAGRPIINASGRFVWLREGDSWPSRIIVDPRQQPYLAPPPVTPPRPADMERPTEDEQRVSIRLRPAADYDFSAGTTVVSGVLRQRGARDAAAVAGAQVVLQWRDSALGRWVPAALPALTDSTGRFAVFVRLGPDVQALPDLVDGFLRVRLKVTHAGSTAYTRPSFRFIADPAAPAGRVREGYALPQPLRLDLDQLVERNPGVED